MKYLNIQNNIWVISFIAVFFWLVFIIALAWSVMRYNYAVIPRDISISNSIEAIVVMGIVVSVIPFMVATILTYTAAELFSKRN